MNYFYSLIMSLILLTNISAYANKDNDTLKIAFSKELENVDSYFNSSREGVILQRTIWDGLIYRDPISGEYSGNLATQWKWIDDVTLELKLRKGVKFHNGEEFNADDVVYTVNFVADIKNGVKTQRNVDWMKSAEKIDDFTVRILLKEPFPAAIEYLAGPVSIYPNEYYAQVGATGMGLEPVGTGPYEVTKVVPGQEFVLETYEEYHDSPKGSANIKHLNIRTIPDINTQVAELFNGNLDWIWEVPPDQAEKLEQMGKYSVVNEATMRIGYVDFDAIGKSSSDNPFTKLKVRQAMSHAIDRQAIVDALLKGKSKVVHSACFPTQFGCTEDVVKYDYNPEKAKQLLSEAGYADGFETSFYAYRNRDYAEAISGYLNAVGIKTDFRYLQYSALRELRMNEGTPISFQTWGSYSINDASAIVSQFFKHGDLDFAKDDEIKSWLDIADSSIEDDVRIENYAKALNKIAEQAYWLPLFSYNSNYVYSQQLDYTPVTDAIPRFFHMKWK